MDHAAADVFGKMHLLHFALAGDVLGVISGPQRVLQAARHVTYMAVRGSDHPCGAYYARSPQRRVEVWGQEYCSLASWGREAEPLKWAPGVKRVPGLQAL